MDLNILFLALKVAFARAGVGWFKNSIADGKITAIELKELAISVLVMTVSIVAIDYGFSVDNDLISAFVGLGVNELIKGARTWYENYQKKKAASIAS